MKFDIPSENFDSLIAKLEKLSDRAVKLGGDPITFEQVGERFETWTNPSGDKIPVKIIELEVTGKTPKLNGWAFVAKLEHRPTGNVIYKLGDDDVPEKFRTIAPFCEHCQLKRDRINTYIVVSDDGEYKQVGSSCLKDFTGHANPERLAQCAEYLRLAYEEAGEKEFDPFAYQGGSEYMNLKTYLEHVAWTIRNYGWTSRGDVYSGIKEAPATADAAIVGFYSKYNRPEIADTDRVIAEKAIDWVRGELAYQQSLNDYEWNLVQVLGEDVVYITEKQAGIAASVIIAYKHTQERKATTAATSEYVGTIKKRQVFDNLALVFSTSFDGYYGPTYLYKFQDEAGNVLVWKTGNFYDWYDGETVVSGKATVKEHSEYRGTKQTVLTRCKFDVVAEK